MKGRYFVTKLVNYGLFFTLARCHINSGVVVQPIYSFQSVQLLLYGNQPTNAHENLCQNIHRTEMDTFFLYINHDTSVV